ncbi:hypothetical protein PBRA_008488 [Plasmodiophora brassicae]|uniref:non-specific serine/threonine protein kinase n=1 Tax=Plasmodiophora brassicae TaxID=37360 RepID=A0A0G4J1M7_PLABS|nr:hypothetical protein PBRA_008488 [Plasmodiophora brassicae]
MLVSIRADTGNVLWRIPSKSPFLSASHVDGIPIGASRDSQAGVILPGVDGNLFYMNGDAVEPIDVSLQEIAERTPFQTSEGTRFIATKHSHVVLVDGTTGMIVKRLSPDGWGAPDDTDAGFADSDDTCASGKPAMPSRTLWIGKADVVVSAIDLQQPLAPSWNISYSEITSFLHNADDTAFDTLPEIFASSSGHVWARDRQTHAVLWKVKLGSCLASVHAQVRSDIVRVPHRYANVKSMGSTTTLLRTHDTPVVARVPRTGQAFVVSNGNRASYARLQKRGVIDRRQFTHLLPAPQPPQELAMPEEHRQALPLPEPPRPPHGRVGDSIHITVNLPTSTHRILIAIACVIVALAIWVAVHRRPATVKPDDAAPITSATAISPAPSEPVSQTQQPSNASGVLAIGKISIQTRSLLGLGSQGTIVFDGFFEGRPVAVKRLQRHLYSHASREISLMIESDSHPAVLRYFAREDDDNFIYVAIERCMCSLGDVVSGTASSVPPLLSSTGAPLPVTLRLLSEIIGGLHYLHSMSIVHKDLKPANILITEDLKAKIADMGLSTRLEQSRSSFDFASAGGGSTGWHAAEFMQPDTSRLTRSVDIFSVGCIIYYVLTRGQHPFGDSYQRDAAILKGAYNLDRIRHLPEAVNLIQAMISIVPEQRPSCAEILKHPFFWSDEAKLEVRRLPVNARAVVRAADEVRSWQFLQEMSDRVEVEKPESPIRTALECQAPRVVGRSWDRAIDPALLDNLGKYRKYNFGSIRDCLRVIRNKKNHYRDLPVDVQASLGEYPSGFLFYFTSRFPFLLLYSFAFAGRYFAHDASFARHFAGLSTKTLEQNWRLWSCRDDDDVAGDDHKASVVDGRSPSPDRP